MGKLINKEILFLAILNISLLSACTATKWAVIKNSTDTSLEIKGLFTYNQELNVNIKPEEQQTWRYDRSSFDSSRIDERLESIQATNENGCIITYDRDVIEKRISEESWVFIIEQQDLNEACAAQGK